MKNPDLASEQQNIYFRLYRLFLDQKIQWVFCGKFTSEKTDLIIRFFENFLDQENIIQKIQKRAFYIFVEGIQNVLRHQSSPENISPLYNGFLLFQQEGQQIAFTMGNIIPGAQEQTIAERLDVLNKMNRDELNEYYKKVLKNEVLSEKGGAGLGLIEIARKSQNLLKYHFAKLDEDYSIFYLQMVVSDQESLRTSKILEEPLKNITDLHQVFVEQGTGLSFHEQIPLRIPDALRPKTSILLPDDYPDWSGEILYSIINLLRQMFPQKNLQVSPAYLFCHSTDSTFNAVAGLEVPKDYTQNINRLSDLMNNPDFLDIKEKITRPPKLQLIDSSEKKQFVSLTFTFDL